jgi:hypothetical protein
MAEKSPVRIVVESGREGWNTGTQGVEFVKKHGPGSAVGKVLLWIFLFPFMLLWTVLKTFARR